MRSGVAILALVISSFMMVLASCGPVTDPGSTQQQQAQSTQNVTIPPNAMTLDGNAFQPNPVQITVGTTVTWTNTDSIQHTSTSDPDDTTDPWDSGQISPNGGTFSHTFNTPGTFHYHCSNHPTMTGTVEVTGASPTPSPSGSASPSPSPSVTPSPSV